MIERELPKEQWPKEAEAAHRHGRQRSCWGVVAKPQSIGERRRSSAGAYPPATQAKHPLIQMREHS